MRARGRQERQHKQLKLKQSAFTNLTEFKSYGVLIGQLFFLPTPGVWDLDVYCQTDTLHSLYHPRMVPCVCILSVNEYCVNVMTALTVTYRAGKYVWGLEVEEFLFPLFLFRLRQQGCSDC